MFVWGELDQKGGGGGQIGPEGVAIVQKVIFIFSSGWQMGRGKWYSPRLLKGRGGGGGGGNRRLRDIMTVCYRTFLFYWWIAQVVGPFANRTVSGGGGPVTASKLMVTPLDGLSRMGPTAHARGCEAECFTYDSGSIRRAVERSEIVFVCLGASMYRHYYNIIILLMSGLFEQVSYLQSPLPRSVKPLAAISLPILVDNSNLVYGLLLSPYIELIFSYILGI